MTDIVSVGRYKNVFGLDIGGSGIKGAPVDTETGELLQERVRIKTPQPATPEAIVRTAVEVVSEAGWRGPVGCGFPAVVKDGVLQTAANVDEAAIGFDLRAALHEKLDTQVSVVNDADAAGLAEMRWGAGKDHDGVVLMLTLAQGSAPPCSSGDGWCRTPSWAISRCVARTPSTGPPTPPASATT